MVTRSRGMRTKTRYKLKKDIRDRGIPSISRVLHPYEIGDTIAVKINSGVHRGMPHPKFQGKIGKISEQRGAAYVINIKDGNKEKQLIARKEHIIPLR